MNIKLLFLFLILIISISVLFYYTFSGSYTNDESSKLNELNINYSNKNIKDNTLKETKGDGKTQLILYWANWCGICNKIKPNWNSAKKIINVKYPNIEVLDINCDNPKLDKCFIYNNKSKNNLDGVPTIILRKNNVDVEYKKDSNFKGDRSVEELVKFCTNNI